MVHFSPPQSPFSKIFLTFITLALGLGAVGVIYTASSGSTDIRSRAAQDYQTYKVWEFDRQTNEGWKGDGVGLTTFGGNLNIVRNKNTKNTITIGIDDLTTTLPPGKKVFTVHMAIGSSLNPTLGVQNDLVHPQTIVEPAKKQEKPFVISVNYSIKGKDNEEQPLILTGIANGKFQEYALEFPSSLTLQAVTLTQLRLDLSQLDPSYGVKIDWIHLEGTYKLLSTP